MISPAFIMVSAGLPFYSDIVVNTLTEIDGLLTNFVFNGYAALSDYLRVPLGLIATLYIVWLGMGMMLGWMRVNMGEFVKAIVKIGWIYMAVTQWNVVSEYLVGLVNSAVGELGDALISASPIHIPGIDGIDGALQSVLIQFTQLGAVLFNTGGLNNWGGFLDGVVVWGFGYTIVGLGLFEMVLAKVMLAVLFIFTPLIVLGCFFKPFQSMFDRWLGAIIGFALLQLFVTATLALSLSLAYWWLAAHRAESALNIGNYGTLPVIIIGGICIGFILKAASLAQNLGGVISTSSGAAMLGGMVGGFIGGSLSGTQTLSSAFKLGSKGFVGVVHGMEGLLGSQPSSTASSSSKQSSTIMNAAKQTLREGD